MSLENVLLSIALESQAAVEAKERGATIFVIANGLDRGWFPCLKSMEKRGLRLTSFFRHRTRCKLLRTDPKTMSPIAGKHTECFRN